MHSHTFDFKFPFDVIVSNDIECTDSVVANWCLWRTLPINYRNSLASHGSIYSNASDSDNKYATTAKGARELQKKGYPVVFVFLQHGTELPTKLFKDKNILLLSVTTGPSLFPMIKVARSVLCLSRYKIDSEFINSNKEILDNYPRDKFTSVIDTSGTESRSSMVWKLTHSNDVPPLIGLLTTNIRGPKNIEPFDITFYHATSLIRGLRHNKTFNSFSSVEDTFLNWSAKLLSLNQVSAIITDYNVRRAKYISDRCNAAYMVAKNSTVYNILYVQSDLDNYELVIALRTVAKERFNNTINFIVTWYYDAGRGVFRMVIHSVAPSDNAIEFSRNLEYPTEYQSTFGDAAWVYVKGIENFHKIILKEKPIKQ